MKTSPVKYRTVLSLKAEKNTDGALYYVSFLENSGSSAGALAGIWVKSVIDAWSWLVAHLDEMTGLLHGGGLPDIFIADIKEFNEADIRSALQARDLLTRNELLRFLNYTNIGDRFAPMAGCRIVS